MVPAGLERSLRLDRKLGESDALSAGAGLLVVEYVAVELLWCRLRFVRLLSVREKYSGPSLARGKKVAEVGVSGLSSSAAVAFLDCMKLAQSCRLGWWSSGGVRNQSDDGPLSLDADMRLPARLERRFRSLSVNVTTRVGRTGPCFRLASICMEQSVTQLRGHC